MVEAAASQKQIPSHSWELLTQLAWKRKNVPNEHVTADSDFFTYHKYLVKMCTNTTHTHTHRQ